MMKNTIRFISLLFALLPFHSQIVFADDPALEVVVTGYRIAGGAGGVSQGQPPPVTNPYIVGGPGSYGAVAKAEAMKKRCESAKRDMAAAENICTAKAKTDEGINASNCSNFSYTVSPNITLKIGAVFSGGVTGSVTYATGAGCRADWTNLANAQIAWCKVNTSNATVAAYKAGGACEGQ